MAEDFKLNHLMLTYYSAAPTADTFYLFLRYKFSFLTAVFCNYTS